MKLAKQAIGFYVRCSGNKWSTFFDNLDIALAGNLNEQTGEMWLVHAIANTIMSNGVTLNELKINKDMIKAEFDESGRKAAGEFFTPEIWCVEGRTYFDKYIPDWHQYNVWDASCGSGNLMRTSGHPTDKLFLSTLQEDDVELVKNTPEYEGAEVFQCDFLNGIDYDKYNAGFVNNLPERLQSIIKNDEPLIIYMNPPYKSGMALQTEVGRHMNDVGMSRPAYDMFYQFCWRVMNIVEMYELKNCYFSFFGPLQMFTGASPGVLVEYFEHVFEFIDGMCLSAQEFSDTSSSISWGIGCSLWKSRGGYVYNVEHKDVLLEKKYIIESGIGCEGKILYEQPREKLSAWVEPRDVMYYKEAPLMTSHLTFKGGEVFEKVAYGSGKMDTDALGTLMIGNTLTRSASQSAVLSMPTTIQYVSINEENFWRCVSSYTFRRVVEVDWSLTKKEISAPNTNIEGYDVWVRNALVLFLFEYKSMMSSLRDVVWGAETVVIRNKLFYLTEEEVRTRCDDPVILEDLNKNPLLNQFMLKQIEESMPYWFSEVKALYDWCKEYTLFTYNLRKNVAYKGSLECWDAGFQQIRSGGIWTDELSEDLTKLLVAARDRLKTDIFKFGFVSDVITD